MALHDHSLAVRALHTMLFFLVTIPLVVLLLLMSPLCLRPPLHIAAALVVFSLELMHPTAPGTLHPGTVAEAWINGDGNPAASRAHNVSVMETTNAGVRRSRPSTTISRRSNSPRIERGVQEGGIDRGEIEH
jgi:hypothetical protein